MKKFLIPLVSVALALGCADLPTGTDGLTPDLGVAGKSGCYTVNFTVELVGSVYTGFTGIVSGDLVGTSALRFDLSTYVTTGVKRKAKVEVEYNITDGILTELVGKPFDTSASGGYTTAPDNDPGVAEVYYTERAKSGVAKANLVDRGNIVGLYVGHLQVRGVICPL